MKTPKCLLSFSETTRLPAILAAAIAGPFLLCCILGGLASPGHAADTVGGNTQTEPVDPPKDGPFHLPHLPYEQNALAPYMSARTLSFHFSKHHQTYVDNLNKLVIGTPLAGKTLEQIVTATAGSTNKATVFNNAAQVWNHTFFWRCMKKDGGGRPDGRLLQLIEASFGSYDKFRSTFIDTALSQFGSGWTWLVQDGDALKIERTSNADTPMAHSSTVLLACDVWEHAYYLDYQNRRKEYLETFLDHLVNWNYVESQLK